VALVGCGAERILGGQPENVVFWLAIEGRGDFGTEETIALLCGGPSITRRDDVDGVAERVRDRDLQRALFGDFARSRLRVILTGIEPAAW
jgi:hypothetical protein